MKPRVRSSGLDDLFRCHGSRLMRARVGERSSVVATAGNWGHYDAATRLVSEFEAIHLDESGQPAPLEQPKLIPGWAPSWFDVWMVDFYVRVIRETMDADMFLEVEVSLKWEFARFILTGHLDTLAISPDGRFAKAWDYKSGEIPVDPADENWQVLGYIILLLLAYENLERVTFYIVQPRNDPDDGWPRVSEVTVARTDLPSLLKELETRVNNALDREMELETGWKQCRYCAAAVQCAAIRKELEAMKHLMTAGELELIQQTPDTDRLMEVFLSLKTLNSAYDQADETVRDRIEQAGGSLAFGSGRRAYFKERNGRRTVKDTAQAHEKLSAVIGPRAIECFEVKPSKTEEVLADALGLPKKSTVIGKASGASTYKDVLGDLTEQSVSKVLCVE